MIQDRGLTVFAPAKINLYLHITGRREDGYHSLDSLAVFADIGDRIAIEPSGDFQLQIRGPFSTAFTAQDRESGPLSSNLVTRAAWALARTLRREPRVKITLTKNLPLASGLGGGSADAAAAIWGLMELWQIPLSSPFLPGLMASLGADIPACLRCMPVRMTGIGDVLQPVPDLPDIPAVLVNPLKHCPTPSIFRRFAGPMRDFARMPDDLSSMSDLIAFLREQDNSLTEAAIECVPEIAGIIALLGRQPGCALSRMSGSGATVFGLFTTMEEAMDAAETIAFSHSGWWVRAGTVNSPGRY
jgi:4-diphosphocytidyl-2-C-methyl-D-erythritol kinase